MTTDPSIPERLITEAASLWGDVPNGDLRNPPHVRDLLKDAAAEVRRLREQNATAYDDGYHAAIEAVEAGTEDPGEQVRRLQEVIDAIADRVNAPTTVTIDALWDRLYEIWELVLPHAPDTGLLDGEGRR